MRGLIIVDYSNDFVSSEGALTAGEPAQALDTYIADLAEDFIKQGDFVAFINDLHVIDDTYHPESKAFPPHNIQGTWGRELYGEVGRVYQENKNRPNVFWSDKRRYSAFAGTELDIRLRERNITEIWLVGVVTDICILHTSVDAYNLGYNVTIPEAGVTSFNQVGHKWALDHFEQTLQFNVIRL